jgi:type IV secretory pathway VirB10-like protein
VKKQKKVFGPNCLEGKFMNNFFNHKITTNGISRKKIMLCLVTGSIILIVVVLYGVFYTKEEKQVVEYNEINMYNKNIATSDIEEWLNKQKFIPDQVVKNNNNLAKDSALIKVPAITATPKTESLPQVVTDAQNIKINQTQPIVNDINSINSKALMYKANLNSGNNLSQNNTSEQGNSSISNYSKVESAKVFNIVYNNNDQALDSKIVNSKSPYELKAGSVIPAMMINGINSDLPGEVIALVRDNIYDSVKRKYLLIPQGAKLIGLYDANIAYGQERVLVAWNRIIYPDGSSINLKGMPGSDLQGYSGFYDQVDNKYWKIFGSSFIIGMITAAMQYSQNNTNANAQITGGGINNNPGVGQVVAGSLGQQLGQTGLMLAQKNLNVQPTLIIRPGYPFNIMLTADLILKPLAKIN